MAVKKTSASLRLPAATSHDRLRQTVPSFVRFASGLVVPSAGRRTPGRARHGAMARSRRARRMGTA